jgi:hypothetical protein
VRSNGGPADGFNVRTQQHERWFFNSLLLLLLLARWAVPPWNDVRRRRWPWWMQGNMACNWPLRGMKRTLWE